MRRCRCISAMNLDTFRFLILTISSFTLLVFNDSGIGATALAQDPSFNCTQVEGGSIEAIICQDSKLSALDRELAAVYQKAAAKVTDGPRALLRTEQRGWIKGRDDCSKSDNRNGCIVKEYQQRIAFLQASYDLIPGTGPIPYLCGDTPDDNILVTYYRTDPPTLIARYRNTTSLMFQEVAASGTKYRGRNEIFWEHQREALVVWGYGTVEMHCRKKDD